MSKAVDAFDPDRDPFNPEREGWPPADENGGGWKENLGLRSWAPDRGLAEMWGVWEADDDGQMKIVYCQAEEENVYLYVGNPIPHRTVVSILIANGYEPEVRV